MDVDVGVDVVVCTYSTVQFIVGVCLYVQHLHDIVGVGECTCGTVRCGCGCVRQFYLFVVCVVY